MIQRAVDLGMICSDYHLIFPKSNRWLPWHLFEQEVTEAKNLEPYWERRKNALAELELIARGRRKSLDQLLAENEKRPDYEPYFYRSADYSVYESDRFVQDTGNSVITYEDISMRRSILYRTQRRQLINDGVAMCDEAVKELFDKECKEACDSHVWTEVPKPEDLYEEWEGFIYMHTQHLVDGYYGTGFRGCFESMRFPSAPAYNNWAYDLMKCGWLSDALGVLQSALEMDFECHYVWHTMSEVYETLGMADKAEWAVGEYRKIGMSRDDRS